MQPSAPISEAKQQDKAPLDEGEINRLIAAARAETYRPSDTPLHPTGDTFRPKSLLDLALLRRDAEKADALAAAAQSSEASQTIIGPGQGLGDEDIASAVADTRGFGIEDAVLAEGPPQDQQDLGIDHISTAEDQATLQPASDAVVTDPIPAEAPPATLDGSEMRDQIRAEAFAAGRAEAEAEAEARLSTAVETLAAAAHAFQHPTAEMMASLRAEITEAVLKLASDRAGLEIDTIPDAFVERIETLADRIHGQATQAVLRLNPEDHEAIAALIAGSDSLASMRVVTSAELSRGDVDLVVDGLRISDRILGQPARRKTARAAAKPEQDKT
ncbi:FliH/SctL family protein [Roseicyclus sp.]|uniref:FliH/SctL family protein n=1 Tax=Roseicyclus sp. TaxID=1914329 RepID=UPI001BD06D69|nr:FliH/SctL family protein [Roseicyclus sp.]